ncbi:hypothetical protein RHMOL_Rhmol05G0223600 [Rhododendron molle]|uniref:Uncharacterized protein n=1 Tax=Rhododendron molle TaxID=49168 RepID=A0ACC0NU00_RHOML|nr:hypothetical protein RHMOL_Rhmol05G0223600 [Rhododendron molle]
MCSSSSYTSNYSRHNGDKRCGCGRKTTMRPSLIVKNSGRRFLGFVNYKIYQHAKEGWNMLRSYKQKKKEELERQVEDLKMMNEELGRGKQQLEEENDAMFMKIAELTEINVKLAAQTGLRKTQM